MHTHPLTQQKLTDSPRDSGGMMNFLYRFLLVSTSLVPVCGAMAIRQIADGKPWIIPICLFAAIPVLAIVCWVLLNFAAKNAQKQLFFIKEFERTDQQILVFLFVYLMPFLHSTNSTFTYELLMSIYVITIITLAIAHVDAIHFNPMMYCLGYHFYAVKNGDGVSNLLISKTKLRKPCVEVQTVRITPGVYLHLGDTDA